jgi:hypothetical protein
MQYHIVFIHVGMNPIFTIAVLCSMEGSRVCINLVETLCGLRNEHPVIVNIIPLFSVVAVNPFPY